MGGLPKLQNLETHISVYVNPDKVQRALLGCRLYRNANRSRAVLKKFKRKFFQVDCIDAKVHLIDDNIESYLYLIVES